MAFDADGNLYVARYSASRIAKLHDDGTLEPDFIVDGLYAPQAVAIDQGGDIYVGNLYAGLRVYEASGGFLGTITPDRIESFDLSPDESTIFYGDGNDVRRVSNTIPGLRGEDFASDLVRAFGMRLRDNGELLVADRDDIRRSSPDGDVMAAYDVTGEDDWFALDLDPDGETFWAAGWSGSTIHRFDIATGRIVTVIETGDSRVGGLAILSPGPVSPASPAASGSPSACRAVRTSGPRTGR